MISIPYRIVFVYGTGHGIVDGVVAGRRPAGADLMRERKRPVGTWLVNAERVKFRICTAPVAARISPCRFVIGMLGKKPQKTRRCETRRFHLRNRHAVDCEPVRAEAHGMTLSGDGTGRGIFLRAVIKLPFAGNMRKRIRPVGCGLTSSKENLAAMSKIHNLELNLENRIGIDGNIRQKVPSLVIGTRFRKHAKPFHFDGRIAHKGKGRRREKEYRKSGEQCMPHPPDKTTDLVIHRCSLSLLSSRHGKSAPIVA